MPDHSESSSRPVAPAASPEPSGLSRRGVLRAAAATGALGIPLGAAIAGASPAAAAPGLVPAAVPDLPAGLVPYLSPYINWAGEITHGGLWACAPRTGQDLADLANWARANGWRLRPRGKSHNWSPLTITPSTGHHAKVLLLDTTKHLTAMELTTPPPAPPARSGRRRESPWTR